MSEHQPLNAVAQRELYADKAELAEAVAGKLLAVTRETLRHQRTAHLVLTGGSAGIATLAALADLLRTEQAEPVQWSSVHFWWGDERFLPRGDAERNDQQAWEALLEYLVSEQDLPQENIHSAGSPDDQPDVAAAARSYAEDLAAFTPDAAPGGTTLPRFTVHLVGVGPDGHINSLFPGRPSLEVRGRSTVEETDSPKPPAERITLTYEAVASADHVWTVVSGKDKAPAVAAAFAESTVLADIPAIGARGLKTTVWHLDMAASSAL